MGSGFKFLVYGGLRLALMLCLLALSSLPVMAAETKDRSGDSSEKWRLVWVEDFGAEALPDKDLAPKFEGFVRSVTIHTAMIDGELKTVNVSAGCNWIGRESRRRVVTPAKTTETLRDGKAHYETVPATFETYHSWVRTQKACYFTHEVNGQKYEVHWMMDMEDFLAAHAPNIDHARERNELEWIDKAGRPIARFEKLPDIFTHHRSWRLDPEFHEDDPVLARHFGPATITLSFPRLSSHRACERLFAPVEFTETEFQIPGEVKSYPCKNLSYLLNGERRPYTPGQNSPENLLKNKLPDVAQYTASEEGEGWRLTLSDKNGKGLLHLISFKQGSLTQGQKQARIYDRLDDHDWIMQPTANVSRETVSAVNPIRIFKHHGYKQKGPKYQAAILSAQNCAVRALKVNEYNQAMNVYEPSSGRSGYDSCEGEAVETIRAEWASARNILYDDDYLIFYDEDWTEVMRARRGARLADTPD